MGIIEESWRISGVILCEILMKYTENSEEICGNFQTQFRGILKKFGQILEEICMLFLGKLYEILKKFYVILEIFV